MGYDPVFRTQPAPSAIQPAPNPPPSLIVAPQNPSPYPSAPAGYVPAGSQPYPPPLPAETTAPTLEQFDYGPAIDPALEGNTSGLAAVQNSVDSNIQQLASSTVSPSVMDAPAELHGLKGEGPLFSDLQLILCEQFTNSHQPSKSRSKISLP